MEQLFKVRKGRPDLFKKRHTPPVRGPLKAPDNLYKSCPQCKESILFEDPMHNLYVCPYCGHHMRLTARKRLRQIVDGSSFAKLDRRPFLRKEQLAFPGYEEKLSRLRKRADLQEAVVCSATSIGDFPCAITVVDNDFSMGSMGQIIGEKITRCIEYATRKKLPLLIFTTSGGARMQGGIFSLAQVTKASAALAERSDAGLLYVSYLIHPMTGGANAGFAMLGDIILSKPDCLIGFAGKRVIASMIEEELPADFQKAELLLEGGSVDAVVERKDSKDTLRRILKLRERRVS